MRSIKKKKKLDSAGLLHVHGLVTLVFANFLIRKKELKIILKAIRRTVKWSVG
jgi:hypothetical protein